MIRAMPDLRNAAGQFVKGQSGNPGGQRKSGYSVSRAAREHTDDAIATLASVMMDEKAPHTSRVAAAAHLLDRGHGKAHQTINVRQLEDMTPEELTDEFDACLSGLDQSIANHLRAAAADNGPGGSGQLPGVH